MASLLRRLVRANRTVCAALERRLPHRLDISALYEQVVGRHMQELGKGATVLDAGGGQRCAFAKLKPRDVRVVAVDSSAEQLRANRDADETRVADLTGRLPFRDEEVGMVVSKHVLEHLKGLDRFIAESFRVLVPGGRLISYFPARHAPFAVVNRLLPAGAARALLYATYPDTEGSQRFRAYYDRCSYSSFGALLTASGFEVEEVHLSYYQSHYFGFFVPLYLVSACCELMSYYAGFKDLAANLLFVARKKQHSGTSR